MSRRPRAGPGPDETTVERLRRGKSQDGSHTALGLTATPRTTGNFLSPDATHGITNLERAHSLSRLHAQSSTETSGLGETVTSGFSSQESVHSYTGEDKDRGLLRSAQDLNRRYVTSTTSITGSGGGGGSVHCGGGGGGGVGTPGHENVRPGGVGVREDSSQHDHRSHKDNSGYKPSEFVNKGRVYSSDTTVPYIENPPQQTQSHRQPRYQNISPSSHHHQHHHHQQQLKPSQHHQQQQEQQQQQQRQHQHQHQQPQKQHQYHQQHQEKQHKKQLPRYYPRQPQQQHQQQGPHQPDTRYTSSQQPAGSVTSSGLIKRPRISSESSTISADNLDNVYTGGNQSANVRYITQDNRGECRQRYFTNVPRDKDISITSDSRGSTTYDNRTPSFEDRQRRQSSLSRQKTIQEFELEPLHKGNDIQKTKLSPTERKRRLASSSGSHDTVVCALDYNKKDDIVVTRQNSNGNKPERSFVVVGKSRSKSRDKDDVTSLDNFRSNSKDSVFRQDTSHSSSSNTGNSPTDLLIKDKERRSSGCKDQHKSTPTNSRTNSDECHESGSSKKSFETVRYRSNSQESRLNSEEEVGNSNNNYNNKNNTSSNYNNKNNTSNNYNNKNNNSNNSPDRRRRSSNQSNQHHSEPPRRSSVEERGAPAGKRRKSSEYNNKTVIALQSHTQPRRSSGDNFGPSEIQRSSYAPKSYTNRERLFSDKSEPEHRRSSDRVDGGRTHYEGNVHRSHIPLRPRNNSQTDEGNSFVESPKRQRRSDRPDQKSHYESQSFRSQIPLRSRNTKEDDKTQAESPLEQHRRSRERHHSGNTNPTRTQLTQSYQTDQRKERQPSSNYNRNYNQSDQTDQSIYHGESEGSRRRTSYGHRPSSEVISRRDSSSRGIPKSSEPERQHRTSLKDESPFRGGKRECYRAERQDVKEFEHSGGNMDYDHLFTTSSRGVNGLGGGGGGGRAEGSVERGCDRRSAREDANSGNRNYPAVLDGGYSSMTPARRPGGGQFGAFNSNNSNSNNSNTNNTSNNNSNNNTIYNNGDVVMASSPPHATTRNINGLNNNNSTNNSIPNNTPNTNTNTNTKSPPYTTFQVPPSTPKYNRPIPTVQLTMTSDDPHELPSDHPDYDWERRGSNKWSTTSRGSSRRGSATKGTHFLGVSTDSAWTKWSRDRRASYRRRIERMERADSGNHPQEIGRVPTPVKKARQEGLKFVSPDLEGTYLSEDDLNELRIHKQQQVKVMRVIEKTRKNKFRMKSEVKLSAEQWHILQDFWDHTLFVRTRLIGLAVSIITIIIMIVSITNNSWVSFTDSTTNHTVIEGLFDKCVTLSNNGTESCGYSDGRGFDGGLWDNCYQNLSDSQAVALCPDKKPHWQNAVIGLMIFATAFGFLASVLSVCGVCTNPLPRKIYYFHSAGEIFLISALSTGVALVIFPIAVEIDSSIKSHSFGIGYAVGWGGAFFFLAAAVCMSLDDLVRESSRAKCCRWCWRHKQNDRNELRQV